MSRIFFIFMTLIAVLGHTTFAQEPAPAGSRYDEAKEAEIAVKAKKRLYAGGKDEEELKVQTQLTTPVRKVAPQTEVKEEPSEE